jgi:glycolate oxidase iron-sulfur subunit
VPVAVAYHDACHLAHAQGIRESPRELIRSIPGVTLVSLPEAEICCGSAGSYNVEQPEIAARLGARKADAVARSGADLLATGNIGCATQIGMHLRKNGREMPIRHTIELLDWAYCGGDPRWLS